ncbi:MAG TPA: hypothetical protein VHU84_17130, partial [Lacipirellulaceae bacterium]|nr:hypothetical protein [Lacipirellulaceae bacterium]
MPLLRNRVFRQIVCALGVSFVSGLVASGQTLLLKDGRKLEGKYAELASIADNPLNPKTPAGEVPLTPILAIDDGLRRTYIHTSQVKQILEDKTGREVKIDIWQPVAGRGGAIGRIGRATRIT